MRLLRLDATNFTFSLVERVGSDIPPYLILSHTWGQDEDEVTFKDIRKRRGHDKAGYQKLYFCARKAIAHNLEYIWIDTCCIDKSSSAELSEAINSMFRWYRDSAVCVVWMPDYSSYPKTTRFEDGGSVYEEDEWATFRKSRWFTRGWVSPTFMRVDSMDADPAAHITDTPRTSCSKDHQVL